LALRGEKQIKVAAAPMAVREMPGKRTRPASKAMRCV
jgi:hypothetical protein